MIARRFVSTSRTLRFLKEAANLSPRLAKATSTTPSKWAPSNGNSFRTFAEYRLVVVNQSPLAIRNKATIASGHLHNVRAEAPTATN